jgi:DNA replication protein DnaC
MTDEQCILSTPWLRGLDLKTKEWGQFLVDELTEITWNESAFENLVLPNEDKALAWEFVQAKQFRGTTFDDFIAEKGEHLSSWQAYLRTDELTKFTGKGLIILLFGPPGVGKTYTAEAGS